MGFNLFLRIIICVFSVCFGEEVLVPHKVVSGGRMSLPCDISSPKDGKELDMVMWYKDEKGHEGVPIYILYARFGQLDQAKHFPNTELIGRAFFNLSDQPASLHVDRVTAKDEGIYWCKVYFKSTLPDTVEEVIVPQNMVPNGRISFPCDISSPKDGKELDMVMFYKDEKGHEGVPIYILYARFGQLDQAKHFPNTELIGRAFFNLSDQPASFHVDRVTAEDEGLYWCTVYFKRSWRSRERDSILLVTVVEPPKFVTNMTNRNVTVLENSNVTLSCKATGRPPPEIKWRRAYDQPFTIGGIETREYINEELHFVGVTMNHAGAYICEASNEVPPAISRRIYLNVKMVPKYPPFVWIQDERVGARVFDDVNLECQTYGHPTDSYWLKDGQLVSSKSSRYHVSILTNVSFRAHMMLNIGFLQPEDYGFYQCVAINPLGERRGTIELFRQHLPTRPTPKAITDGKIIFPTKRIIIGQHLPTRPTPKAITDGKIIFPTKRIIIVLSDDEENTAIRTIHDRWCTIYLCALYLFWMHIFKNWR